MAQHILGKLEQVAEMISLNRVDKHPSLQFIEKKIQVKPSSLILILLALLIPLLLFLAPVGLVLGVAAYAVPAVMTFRAMETKDKDKHMKYLVYWAIFAVSEIIDPVGQWVTGPFIWLLVRLVIVVALLHPRVEGSLLIYKKLKQTESTTTINTEATPTKSGDDLLVDEPKKTV